MKFVPNEDLRAVCREIAAFGLTTAEWAERESSDIFQTGRYCGGFDATEGEFCFETQFAGVEYWFQFSLEEALRIAAGETVPLKAWAADK